MASYDEEFKKRLVRMHLEEGRTIKKSVGRVPSICMTEQSWVILQD